MKITYLHQHFRFPHEQGGSRPYEFARRLAQRGHEVHVIAGRDTSRMTRRARREEYDGFTIHFVHAPYHQKMNFAMRVLSFIRFATLASLTARRLNANLVFASSTPLTIFIPAWFAVAGRRTPLVFEVRDLWPTVPIEMGILKNPILKSGAQWLEKKAYTRSNHIIALSIGMKDGIIQRGITSSKVTVIPNAADIEAFTSTGTKPPWAHREPSLDGRPIVLYCGTVGAANGVEYLPKLAARVREIDKDIAFVIVGDGREMDKVLDVADKEQVRNINFFTFPPVPKSDVPVIFREASISLALFAPFPSLETNSANKLFDAMAAGVPIAINYGGWQRELLEKEGCGIALSRDDFDSAAQQLVALLKDAPLRKEMAENAARVGRHEFSRDEAFRRLHLVLLSVVN